MATYNVDTFMQGVQLRNPGETEFHQVVKEFVDSVIPVVERNPLYEKYKILDRMVEPERTLTFRVPWIDDRGEVQMNRGYRVAFNSAIGPCKGGFRFHPTVNRSIVKFLGFEEVFKNALTGLPFGGGKIGADFDYKGKSDNEVMRFCQAFMTETFRNINGSFTLSGRDIGVGEREIGYLYGQYKKLMNNFDSTSTTQGIVPTGLVGLMTPPESTGYGIAYFVNEMLATKGDDLKGKQVVITGCGNAAQYVCEKVTQLGAKVIALSDSDGFILDTQGIDSEKLRYIKELKNIKRGRLSEYPNKFRSGEYRAGKGIWNTKCDVAIPCATQNELTETDASILIKNGVKIIAEGASMPVVPTAIQTFLKANVLFAPSIACTTGSVFTSALTGITMNNGNIVTTGGSIIGTTNPTSSSANPVGGTLVYPIGEKLDQELRMAIKTLHQTCTRYASEYGVSGNYVRGANICSFIRVADSMITQGLV